MMVDDIYDCVSINVKSSNEVWEDLCTKDVEIRKRMVGIFIHEYEWFTAQPGETLTQIFDRFYRIITYLGFFGKVYDAMDVNYKFMRVLPQSWDDITTIISTVKDMESMSLEKLYGKLRVYELEREQRRQWRADHNKENVDVEGEEIDDTGNVDVEGKEIDDTGNLNKRGGFKNGVRMKNRYVKIDMLKCRCFNCNRIGHFASKCKEPKIDEGYYKKKYFQLLKKIKAVAKADEE